MKKEILFIGAFFFLFYSCKTRIDTKKIIPGVFEYTYKKGKGSKEELILNDDSTFVLTSYTYFQPPTCNGNWSIINNDTILIKCNPEEHPLAPFVTGYMEVRIRKIKIINNNKLKMPIENNVIRRYVILKRIK